jgi:hypothetical protein
MDNFEEAKSYFLKGLSALETKNFMDKKVIVHHHLTEHKRHFIGYFSLVYQ